MNQQPLNWEATRAFAPPYIAPTSKRLTSDPKSATVAQLFPLRRHGVIGEAKKLGLDAQAVVQHSSWVLTVEVEPRGIKADRLGEVEPPPPPRWSPGAMVANGRTDGLDCRGVRQVQTAAEPGILRSLGEI